MHKKNSLIRRRGTAWEEADKNRHRPEQKQYVTENVLHEQAKDRPASVHEGQHNMHVI